MTPDNLRDLLEGLDRLDELVFHEPVEPVECVIDPLYLGWLDASAEAGAAYARWRAARDAESYAVYRASADRADAAQDALAAHAA